MRSLKKFILASVMLSFVATLMVFRYVSNTESRVVAGLQPTKVLIATQDIAAGTKALDLENFTQEVVVPQRSFPSGALQRVADARPESVLLSRVLSGSFIFRDQLGAATRLVGGLVVPIGKVVLTVELSGPERLGRFIQPGATVAVYSTKNGASNIIVTSAEVLAISDDLTAGGTTTEKAPVTLALDPEAAKRLLSAQQTSSIRLALLGSNIPEPVSTGGKS